MIECLNVNISTIDYLVLIDDCREITLRETYMPRKPVKNGFQRRQFPRGERRLRGDEVKRYLALANSEDPQDRIEALENLCPCHVRKRIDVVWDSTADFRIAT